jgi:flagellin-specific chaperone FliS
MAKYPKEYLEKTIKLWQPYCPEPLSLEDAQEIADNVIGLYSYLLQLKENHEKKETKA